ncbi:hypothetical protein EUTSA_v10011223mg [Eutrema salsugineum]|uniref:Protein kinase domain-containing protein n=1 Tax=Eutrema salsugineum TaxID=72664 RepID=V4KGG8_EUTSA|nr:LRR receptor-like serine/threonine-protein kinase IOS1 [Eutrema salsugineum]ESQ30279.1 hypothetical protein EUTSA_v10011223mg [Eutrema salsugineum]
MAFPACLLLFFLQLFSALYLSLAQDQSGFITLDCGSPRGTTFRERTTNLTYISDANFINTGVGRGIQQAYRTQFQQQAWNLRSFPQGIRNCYTLNLTTGDKYLIRASFLHGGYDDKPSTEFELHLGPNLWTKVSTTNETQASVNEMIHVLTTDRLQICLVKTGNSTPFISALELRKLMNTTYLTQQGSLQLFIRADVGATVNQGYRFGIDVFDRVWTPFNFGNWSQISTNQTINVNNDYQPPEIAMVTASVPTDPDAQMNITLVEVERNVRFYVFMHFAEIQELKSNETREFNIMYNDKRIYGPFRPRSFTTDSVFTPTEVVADANGQYTFSLQRTGNSTLPPLLNGIEVYSVKLLPEQETDIKEVDAMMNIKSGYGVNKIDWEGDPCVPRAYRWSGVNCSYIDNEKPNIISLNLSASGLTGEILEFISDLTKLEVLDLSNNTLTGSVPEFLADMKTLKLINLSSNELNGSIPETLLDKARRGSISLSIEDNTGLCSSGLCATTKKKKKKNTVIAPVAASLVSVFLIASGIVTFLILKRKKRAKLGLNPNSGTGTTPLHHHGYESPVISKNRKLTYIDVVKITNNFERVLGKGGFGVVYYGVLDNQPVAVKMLTESTALGYKQFKAEVELLLRVHHKDLTCLVGYCEEGDKLSLIYEFMANGDLKEHLSGKRGPSILTWEGRLRIAAESAQGLEYLHNGCKPQIVHRDIKTTNILLNEKFQAKLADFGLSRSFPLGTETHVSTVVAGTPGYLDPEYYRTNWLTEKSDVFSFGVVLLELVTNQPVIDQKRERPHIGEWVGLMLSRGDINSIVDPKLQGDFDPNTIWKVVETAMTCLNPSSSRRPTMTQVVMDLKESLNMEMARNMGSRMTDSTNNSSIELSMNFTTELHPGAR